jgi:hypothetical protein
MTDNTKTCRPSCSLSPDRLRARTALIAAILNDTPHQETSVDRGRRLTFTAERELEAQLRQLVWPEHECCPFLDLVVELRDEGLTLTVTGDDSVQDQIAEIFGRI